MTATHAACTHRGYALTCEEFDQLRARSEGRCELCSVAADALQIDHDHALGGWAVRGLVCHYCNSRLRHVDSGRIAPSERVRAYFELAWHLTVDTTARRARTLPRDACPTCGLDCAVNSNGSLRLHWSRLPGMGDTRCRGRSPEPGLRE